MLWAGLILCYVNAGRAKWQLFKMTAPVNRDDRLLIAASDYGTLKMRLGGAAMILTWPLWDECAKVILWAARKMGQGQTTEWVDASELQRVAPSDLSVRPRQKSA